MRKVAVVKKPVTHPTEPQNQGCLNCAELRAQLEHLRESRDSALLSLAQEHELANALRLAFPTSRDALAAATPVTGYGTRPLRYAVVDELNERVKKYLKPVHSVSKRITSAMLNVVRPKK